MDLLEQVFELLKNVVATCPSLMSSLGRCGCTGPASTLAAFIGSKRHCMLQPVISRARKHYHVPPPFVFAQFPYCGACAGLLKNSADPSLTDDDGKLALHVAAANGNAGVTASI